MSEESSSRPPPRPGVRASDEDREQLIVELREHTVAGRLTTDEFEERLREAYAARTTGELAVLRRDLPLPAGTMALAHAARRSQLTRRMVQETGGSVAAFAVCTVIWLVAGAHHGSFWPAWVLIAVVISVTRNAWGLYGPAPDLDAVERELDRRRARRARRGDEPRRRGRRRIEP